MDGALLSAWREKLWVAFAPLRVTCAWATSVPACGLVRDAFRTPSHYTISALTCSQARSIFRKWAPPAAWADYSEHQSHDASEHLSMYNAMSDTHLESGTPLLKQGLVKGLARRKFLSSGLDNQQQAGLQERTDTTLICSSSGCAQADVDLRNGYALLAAAKGHATPA
jgi:hypothetical protein